MKLGAITALLVLTVFAAMAEATRASEGGGGGGEGGGAEVMDCTEEQFKIAQQIIAEKLIQKSCMELKMDAAGVPDLTNPAFCQNEICVKAIKTVRRTLPACTYNGKRIRAGLSKLLKVCPESATNKRDDDENDAGSSSSPPKSKRPKTTAPASAQTNGSTSSTGSSNGKDNRVDEESSSVPATSAPAMSAPATTASAKVPSTAAKTSSFASRVVGNVSTTLATMAAVTLWALLS